jgi:hypothetical protein
VLDPELRNRRAAIHWRKPEACHMKVTAALAGALGFCAWGCVNFASALAHAAPPYSEIYQRATNEFACAEYYKPVETKTNEPSFTLAPLILQQVNGAQEPPSLPDRFGTLSVSNEAPVLDQSRPTIYWEADTVQVNGRAHARFSYAWCYFPRPGESEPGQRTNNVSLGRAKAGLPFQGIRITLNSAGQPVIWEVLADSSRAKLFFVSQHLEAAAVAEFGKPLLGRHYSIERSVEAAPDVIVARVIDDSPVSMGPIVYLSAETRQVSTLICRCMSAQARKLLVTDSYNLRPFQEASTNALIMQARLMLQEREAFWPGDDASGKGLGACLRLPEVFSSSKGTVAR